MNPLSWEHLWENVVANIISETIVTGIVGIFIYIILGQWRQKLSIPLEDNLLIAIQACAEAEKKIGPGRGDDKFELAKSIYRQRTREISEQRIAAVIRRAFRASKFYHRKKKRKPQS